MSYWLSICYQFQMKFSLSFILFLVIVLLKQPIQAQVNLVKDYIASAEKSYREGDYASSLIDYQNAFSTSKDLSLNIDEKEPLQLKSLKGIITVSGMGTAMELAIEVFEKHETLIYNNLCASKNKAVTVGLINNFIAVAYHNTYLDVATETYQDFINRTEVCEEFGDIDIIQASANAVLAYSELKQTSKAIELLPLIKYHKDSIPNWSSADYEKVLAIVKTNSSSSIKEIIEHYKKAARGYERSENYRYALNVYNTLLNDYVTNLSTEELIWLIKKSKTAQEKASYYHTDEYDEMMKQFGMVMLERTAIEEENKQLKNLSFVIITIALSIIIILLLITNKRNREKKNIFKRLYTTEKQLMQQQDKLSLLKNNFIKQNYIASPIKDIDKRFFDLYAVLIKDFPQLNFNIHNTYPDLTEKEIQMIYLSLLDISNKESASLLSMTYGSYRVAKNRLLKKMNCANSDQFNKATRQLLN